MEKLDFNWDNQKLWRLDLPIADMDIRQLLWHLDAPFSPRGLKPRDVLKNPKHYPREYARIMDADLAYPINVIENNGAWVIMDGVHRLAKAHLLKSSIIKIKILPRERIPEIRQ
jgi:hypothetical protein